MKNILSFNPRVGGGSANPSWLSHSPHEGLAIKLESMARPKKEEVEKAETGNPVEAVEQKAEKPEVAQEFSVEDPTELRPKELPLVVKPTNGDWKNEAQAEYAKTLNAYAYKNPEKWQEKKAELLKQLSNLGTNPADITKLRGNDTRLAYSNELYKNILSR